MAPGMKNDLILAVLSFVGICVVVSLMPGDPPAAELALQWVTPGKAFAGDCKP